MFTTKQREKLLLIPGLLARAVAALESIAESQAAMAAKPAAKDGK